MVVSYFGNQTMKIFKMKWKKVQYNVCLEIASERKGTSKE